MQSGDELSSWDLNREERHLHSCVALQTAVPSSGLFPEVQVVLEYQCMNSLFKNNTDQGSVQAVIFP